MLDVSVLGTVKASSNGQEHPLGSAKQRGLLARLIVSRGRSLSVDRLIDELWEEAPPRNPGHALQAHISRLRSAIPVPIALSDGGYRIDPAHVQTDAAHFEHLVRQGGASLADGDLSQAAELIADGLDLWQGPAYAGLLDLTALRAESVRLEKVWSAALADRIDLDLALGRSAAVISELHALVEENPLSERYWGQLISALYCDGRAQEALDAFTRARTVFADQLGVEPSSELSRLHLGILHEQPPASLLRLSTSAAADGDVLTPLLDAPVRSLTSNQPNVLAALLRDQRATLLTGPDGIGKTHLLRAIRTRFEAQRSSVSLLTATPLSHAVPLGIFAGVIPEQRTSPAALIDHFTRHRTTTVLLVDNVEQLDEASLFVIGQLIRNAWVPMVLTATDLAAAPDDIRALYDSGEVIEVTVAPLSASDADELVLHTIGGALTPAARPRIFTLAHGNPLHLREILTASVDEDRLVHTPHGWELRDAPASSARLTQLVGERFAELDEPGIEAATKIAIAGEYPASALTASERRMLARADIIKYSAPGWLRLSHPLDLEYLRSRCPKPLWHDLSVDVLAVLQSDAAADSPAARRHAHILALDLGERIEIAATLELAEYALGAFDEHLALRAATAITHLDPDNTAAHRIAGIAASALGDATSATTHFETAARTAVTASEQSAVALAHAQHVGLRHYNAPAALAIIERALGAIDDATETAHLQRDALRWSTVAGQTREIADAPGDTTDAVAVLSLITTAMSGVITGPHSVAEQALRRLHIAPADIIALIPAGAALIDLTAIMSLSNTGDVNAARRRLRAAIAHAEEHSPQSLGAWEYALAFSELLSGDVQHAHEVALSAVTHLRWRDTTGLLPAALALTCASARVLGHPAEPADGEDAIPAVADTDPKVVMLRAWADAWGEKCEGRRAAAARLLIDTARWLLAAQHTFFAGMLAHCAIRVSAVRVSATRITAGREHTGQTTADAGRMPEDADGHADQLLLDATDVLEEANAIAGGGLLEFFVRHAAATASSDLIALEKIADDADALGLASTAADTRALLGQRQAAPSAGTPALWSVGPRAATRS